MRVLEPSHFKNVKRPKKPKKFGRQLIVVFVLLAASGAGYWGL
jgi:hypothetical protein